METPENPVTYEFRSLYQPVLFTEAYIEEMAADLRMTREHLERCMRRDFWPFEIVTE
jgi:hypothetical protein